jgi:hypothetical protein
MLVPKQMAVLPLPVPLEQGRTARDREEAQEGLVAMSVGLLVLVVLQVVAVAVVFTRRTLPVE